ncbi:MAG: hypothetical protein JJT89_01855 [Nitriliruptoraceae bacterium]|nr:hypothetical protein [Nitriliruptoraceae bacterium]
MDPTEGDRDRRSLAGDWRVRLDPYGLGIWLDHRQDGSTVMALPGSTDEAGLGDRNDTAWTDHLSRQYQHIGPVWYQRELTIPQEWSGRRVVLSLERPHWESRVWLDGRYVGRRDSLCAPHEYELGSLHPGERDLVVRVDNTVRIGVGDANGAQGQFNLAHATSDHTQTNWNGIVGRIELRATDLVWVEDVQVHPDLAADTARVVLTLGNATGEPVAGQVRLQATSSDPADRHVCPALDVPFQLATERVVIDAVYPMADARRWDEFSPTLYRLDVRLAASSTATAYHDDHQVPFGMRSFEAVGRQLQLNGRPVFLRGTLECCVFPLTGYPPTDVDAWRRIMGIARAYGLNHLRFHSWCPPRAAFLAADELGFLLQVETPLWAELGSDPLVDAFAYAEGDRILRTYGNHPSFCLMAVSNEPSGPDRASFLGGIVTHWRAQDTRRVYTGGSGWPAIPENDYHCMPEPRSYHWEEGLGARFNAEPFATDVDYREIVHAAEVPIVTHEIGQWTSYPDYRQLAKYTGVLEPRNLATFRASLDANAMLEQADAFVAASGRLQTLLYKEEIEATLRTPEFGGFQLLDLHDFPGQGTALVGVLDAFWDSKGYVTPEEFRRFCAETVLLASMPKVVWRAHETFDALVQVAHFGPEPIDDARVAWRLGYASGERIASGTLEAPRIPFGSGLELGEVTVPLADVAAPSHLVFELALDGTPHTNRWDLWLYPEHVGSSTAVHVTERLDPASLAVLRQGGSVLLSPPPGALRNDIPVGLTTPFWNLAWTGGQPPHTLGVLCDPGHAALAAFPTQSHSNWQWWEVVHEAGCLLLEGPTAGLDPIIQVIDDWRTNRKLALAVEAEVGGGRLLICSADLRSNLDQRPVARQLRSSLLAYMGGPRFAPSVRLDLAAVDTLVERPAAISDH